VRSWWSNAEFHPELLGHFSASSVNLYRWLCGWLSSLESAASGASFLVIRVASDDIFGKTKVLITGIFTGVQGSYFLVFCAVKSEKLL